MIAALLLTLLAVPQEPSAGVEDIVRLKVGTELAGRIVRETADYVELELGDGTIVGFEKSRTTAILRAASASRETKPVEAVARFADHDEWSVLHDGEGRAVGWMHGTLTRTDDGQFRIGEEWRFVDGGKRIETTLLEVLDQSGRPVSAFCHERTRGDDDRLTGERLVNAVVAGDRVVITRRSPRGQERQEYEFAPGTRFPLELRETMRKAPSGDYANETHVVFDPLLEQFVSRTFDVAGTRRVDLGDGKVAHVRVLSSTGRHGDNVEWLDAAGNSIRREIAGPALVAVPVSGEDDARRRVQRSGVAFPPAFRADAGGRFGLWLPSPAWRFADREPRDDEVTAVAPIDDASLSLIRIGRLEADLQRPSAADAVLRWLRLAHRELLVVERRTQRIRGLDAERVRARATRADGRDVELLVHVLQIDGEWFASCGTAPRVAFSLVEPDIEWMVERFELRREGFAPEQQGPLAGPRKSR